MSRRIISYVYMPISLCHTHAQAAREARPSVAQLSWRIAAAAQAPPVAFKCTAQASPATAVCTVKTISREFLSRPSVISRTSSVALCSIPPRATGYVATLFTLPFFL